MILFLLDLAGVAVFAVTGALAAGRKGLDLFGVVVIAAATAIGGGTIRDVLLGRRPIFWIARPIYLVVITAVALATALFAHLVRPPSAELLVADAIGLALFAMSGAKTAEDTTRSPLIVVLMGTLTGAGGGVVRDVLTGEVPLILRRDIYATAAIAGVTLYLVLKALRVHPAVAFAAGLAGIVGLRLAAIAWNWQLPVFRWAS
jgi:uncharacterized membrane protein YeiH